MRTRELTLGAAGLILLALCAGCGYKLSGGGTLPNDVEDILILSFENRTTRPEIEQRVTEAVAREFSRRKRYSLVTEKSNADAVLEGVILSYRTAPVQFTDDGRATRVEASVSIQATLRQTADDVVLWRQSGLIFKEQFDVPESGEFFDEESLALDDIARGAAGALVTAMLEGF